MYGFDLVGGIQRVETEDLPANLNDDTSVGIPPPPSFPGVGSPHSGPPAVPPAVPSTASSSDPSRVSTPPPVPSAAFGSPHNASRPSSGLPKAPAGLPRPSATSSGGLPGPVQRAASPRGLPGLPSPRNASSSGLPRFGFSDSNSVIEQKQPEPVYRTSEAASPNNRSGFGLASSSLGVLAAQVEEMRGEESELKFDSILEQATKGLQMMESMKEVFRKFGKHQKADADKLIDVYERMPQRIGDGDGMEDLAELCGMAHRLIIETVQAQKQLADFVAGTLVPTMTKFLQEREGRLQWIRKNHKQTEEKYQAAVNSMNRAQHVATQATERAKAIDPMKTGTHSAHGAEQPRKRGGFLRGLRKKEVDAEEVYAQANATAETYKAAVMTANHEQEQYIKTVSKLKLNCMQLEKERIDELTKFVNRYLARHCQFFNNDRVTTLQTQILSKIEVTNSHTQLTSYVQKTVEREGMWIPPPLHRLDLPDFGNIFFSLDDAMNLTLKTNPNARVPLVMSVLMQKVEENNGFQTEGIFRISAMQSHLDELRRQLLDGNYVVATRDPHVPAAMLKDWLRGLQDSLIPMTFYDACIDMAKTGRANSESLGIFVSQLPEVNRECIRYLCHFLSRLIVPANQQYTRMNLENVAIVFAPTVLRCPHDDPQIMMVNSKYEKDFMELLIENLPTGYR